MDSISERYRALLEISESIAAHHQLADFFQGLKSSLERIISFDGIGISLYDPERKTTKLYMAETGTPGIRANP